jgi:hypothetical protein
MWLALVNDEALDPLPETVPLYTVGLCELNQVDP